MFTYFQASLSN